MINLQIFEGVESAWEFDAGKHLFRKMVAKTGNFTDSHGQKVELTTQFFDELVKNFKAGDDIPIPLGHAGMKDPTKNTGYVTGLERVGNNLYALMNITEPDVAQKINNKTIKGVSIGVALSEVVGKVLNHIALTLQPALPDLGDFAALEMQVQILELEKTVKGSADEDAILAEHGNKIITELATRFRDNT